MLSSQAVVPKDAAIPRAVATAVLVKWLNFELLTTFFFSIFMVTPSACKFYALSNISYVETMLTSGKSSSSWHIMTLTPMESI